MQPGQDNQQGSQRQQSGRSRPESGATPASHYAHASGPGQARSSSSQIVFPELPATPADRAEAVAASAHPGQGVSLPARMPTLTQQMRAIEPPDVARQVMRELALLAEELEQIPAQLEQSRLAHTHAQSYFAAVRAYVALSGLAWEAVAEERLEQSGAEPDYRQRSIATARRISQLREECKVAAHTNAFQLPRAIPPLWRPRLRLVQVGLSQWREQLVATPRPRDLGRAYLFLQGYTGLAGAGRFELATFRFLSMLALVLPVIAGSGFLLQGITAGLAGAVGRLTFFGIATLAAALVEIILMLLIIQGSVPLGVLLGWNSFAPIAAARDGRWSAPWHAWAQRAWFWIVLFAGLVALGFAISGVALMYMAHPPAHLPGTPAGWVDFVGAALALAGGLTALATTATTLLLAIPVQIMSILRFAACSAGEPGWIPDARRHALEPHLALLATCTSLLAVVTWFLTSGAGLEHMSLLTIHIGPVASVWSWRTLLVLLALILPYLVFLDLPFRLGIRRWRRAWLNDLVRQRMDVEAHVRRLSVTDPVSGLQDSSEENLRSMQYDLVLLQFYRDRMAEARTVPASPFSLGTLLLAALVLLLTAWLIDVTSAHLALLTLAR